MATLPLRSPVYIPTLAFIPGGFRPGYMIRIKGTLRNNGQRISVDLQCGPVLNPLDDIAFHLSVRPQEFAIVRNHYEKHRWGVEERGGGCPIRRGHSYEILILAEASGYKIAIDGTHFCDFRHRIPLNKVQYLHISGDTDVSLVGYETDTGAPVPYQPPPHLPNPSHQSHPPYQPQPPYTPHQPMPPVMPIAPSAPSAPSPPPMPGIIAGPYPGQTKPIYPNLPPPAPMPIPMPIHPGPPPPPPPYTPPYIHRPIETNPYPPPYYSSPYPTQQPAIKIEGQTFATNATPGYAADYTTYSPAPVYVQEKKRNNHTALKVAAAVGGVGLGAYALSRAFSSSSSDSD